MVIPQSGCYITTPMLKEKIKIKRYIQNKFTVHRKRKKIINFVSLVLQTQCFLSELLLSV